MASENKNEWAEKTLAPVLAKGGGRKKDSVTGSGVKQELLYAPDDTPGWEYREKLGYPGEYPFTRGVQPTMYRGRLWTMRQYAGFATAEESNIRYKYLMEQGQTGLSVAFDLPTQIGYDSDDPMSEGEVGKVGVAIDSLEDIETLFNGIPLDTVSTSMTINSTAAILLAFYIVAAEKQGVSPDKLDGTIQNDILKEYAARGTYIYPPGPSMRLITNIFEYCAKNVPGWNTISISGYHMREAGCTAAQEIAFTLANGIAYVEAALSAGLDVDDFAGRMTFFFNAHNDLFEEVAKFRAARRMWAKIMKERFEAKRARSMTLRFHTQTGGSTLTAQQPDNNIVRVTIQTLAAVLGGTQSLHTNSRDEALSLPTEDSVRIALRTQQIAAYESGAADTVDPLGGSYYVESLTDSLEEKAWEYINKIDDMGGAIKAIERGYIQREIAESAYRYQMEIEAGARVVVGLNKFRIEDEPPSGLLKIGALAGETQVAKLRKLREKRDSEKARTALAALGKAAGGSPHGGENPQGEGNLYGGENPHGEGNLHVGENPHGEEDENLMPYIIDCARAYCTIGEISNELRAVFGEYRGVEVI